MTRLLLVFLALVVSPAFADELSDRVAAVPNPRAIDGGWVSDPAGVIASRKADINRLIAAIEQKTGAEIAVVVLPTIGSVVPKDFAVRLVETWGIGKKGRDNGVLVLHILDQRRIEIETGYGMEGALPDVKCRWITEQIAVPFFRKNSFADGHYEVVRALIRGIENPDIKQAQLVSQWEVQPGVTTNSIPNADARGERQQAFFDTHTPKKSRGTLGLIVAVVLLGIGVAIYISVSIKLRDRAIGKTLHEQYDQYRSGFSRLQYMSALPATAAAALAENSVNGTAFASVPVLAAIIGGLLVHRKKKLRELREAPRTCHCGRTMRRASETEDDAFIKPGNVVEEQIRSMDYDVWICDEGHSSVESYAGAKTAKLCPKCNFRTFRVTDTRTLIASTTISTGLSETTHTCANCNHIKRETTTIPKVTPSSSSGSSSSGGSSGGGSFGGGRSGGGGAGSSY